MDAGRDSGRGGRRRHQLPPSEVRRIRWSGLLQRHRILGIAGLSLAAYFLVFVVLGNTNIGWLLPPSPAGASRFHWPELPSFTVRHAEAPDGEKETLYTVPTRKITAQEMAQLPTNQPPQPSK